MEMDREEITTEIEQASMFEATAEMEKRRILVGIDLGTYRTVVMSDNNDKMLIRSVVGYPKDVISQKMVGEGPLFGNEAMEKRNFLDMCFPLAEGVIREASDRDYRAARELVRHVVELVKNHSDVEVCGIIGVPARASVVNKELLLRVAKELMTKTLVVSEPFMVAYSLNKLSKCVVVDIGAGTVDICCMKGSVPAPEDQVTTFKGGDYIDERLEMAIARRYPGVQITKSVACRIKEEHAFVGEPEKPVEVILRAEGKPARFDVTREIRTVCESVVPDILEQVKMLITSFDPEDQEDALRNIYLAGGGSRIQGLDKMIAAGLGEYGEVRVTAVDDPEYIGAAGALRLAKEVPAAHWGQIGLMFGG
jgi:rod shape-determining protein MreB and related proteins